MISPSELSRLSSSFNFAEEGRDGDGFQVPGVEDGWKMGCPKGQMWESEGEARSEVEDASSSVSREGNVCNDALRVVGLHGPGDKISLFLKDWELAKGGTKLPYGPGRAVPGHARGLVDVWLPDESFVKEGEKDVNDKFF